jgi:hypothetical protein
MTDNPGPDDRSRTPWSRAGKAVINMATQWQRPKAVSELDPGDIIITDNPDAKLTALEAFGDQEGGARLWQGIIEGLYAETGTPLITPSTIQGMGTMTGIAIKMLYAKQQRKTVRKQHLHGVALRGLISEIMEILGHSVAASDVIISWPDTLPVNELEAAQVAQIKASLGYSSATLIRDTGGNPETEADNLAQELEADEAQATQALDRLESQGPKDLDA